VTIRRAELSDASAIARLLGELGYPADPGAVAARLSALGDGDRVLLAGDGGGLVALHRVPWLAEGGAFARVTALVVAHAERRRGVGRALLAAVEDVARGWGCDLVEVSSGRRPERHAAHAFYASAGYEETAPVSARYWKRVTPEAPAAV
jgi:GNAT superfamily N-acetyltransferase